MAAKKPLVIASDGFPEELSSSDTLDAPGLSGDVTNLTNGGGGTANIGAPVYISAAGSFTVARANATGTKNVVGLVKDTTIAAAAVGAVLTNGLLVATTVQWDAITGQTGGLTAGSWYFLDTATAGKMTTTAPSTAGNFIVPIGKALSTTDFLVDIQSHTKRN